MLLVDISAISQMFIDFVKFAIMVGINWNNVYLLRPLHEEQKLVMKIILLL